MNEREIFMAALDRESPDERTRFLDEACGDDQEVRRRVEGLLQSHADSGSFLERPVLADEKTLGLNPLTDPAGPQPPAEDEPALPDPDTVPLSLDFLKPCDVPGRLGKLGPYEVIEVIGRGGMGVVFRAHDPKLNRMVAVKVLAPEFAANPTARKRFLREARAAAAVSHPHVVTIHAVDEAANTPYLVMEYIDGLSLQDKIERVGTLKLKEILRIGSQIAAGLAAAHGQGLIHRDIKPGNILLENGVERVKITDFGLARAVDDIGMTRTGEVAGTPEFMSPEQAQGLVVEHRSDLFSLGSVLYAMCTGRSPFRADTTVAVLRRVCDDVPRPIREINPEIPEGLVAIIDRLLAKNPDERLQTSQEVADLLGRRLAYLQHPTNTPPPSPLCVAGDILAKAEPGDKTPVSPHGRPRRRLWAVAGLLLLALLASLSITEATGVTQLAATVIRIATGEGTLVIEVDDPAVSVTIEGEDVVITGAGPKEVRLKPGKYRLQANKNGKPVPIDQQLVSITRGGRQVVRVAIERGSDVASSNDYKSVPAGAIEVVRRFTGHGGYLNGLAFSPDGAFLLSAGGSSAILLWRTETGKLLGRFEGLAATQTDVAFSPDGNRIVASAMKKEDPLRVWNRGTGEQLLAFGEDDQWVSAISCSPDGTRLVSARHDGLVQLWSLSDGQELARYDCGSMCIDIAWSPNGQWFVVGCRNDLLILTGSDARLSKRLSGLSEGLSQFASVAVSANSRRIVSGSYFGVVQLWDVETGKQVRRMEGNSLNIYDIVRSIAFLRDGRHVVSGCGDMTMRIWSVETGREVARVEAANSFTSVLAVSPDGRHVATAGGVRRNAPDTYVADGDYTIRLWRLPESVCRSPESNAAAAADASQPAAAREPE